MSDAELLEIAQRWMRYATEDFAASALIVAEKYPPRHACGAAQQAAEKAMKAIVVHRQIDFPKTHSLKTLNSRLPHDCRISGRDAQLATPSEWAVQSGYPGPWPYASAGEGEEALATATIDRRPPQRPARLSRQRRKDAFGPKGAYA